LCFMNAGCVSAGDLNPIWASRLQNGTRKYLSSAAK
jgi:hypothetical protein